MQRRTLVVLSAAQITGGIGVAVGTALSSLLVAKLSGSVALSGLAGTSTVLGAALLALPTAGAASRGGRRAGLTLAYACAVLGCLVALLGIATRVWPILLVGLTLFGGGSAGNLASRYSATDLSAPGHSARHLAWVVWAATIGSVTGPNLAEPAERLGRRIGLAPDAGPFALSLLAFAIALAVVLVALRPDPLLLARTISPGSPGSPVSPDSPVPPSPVPGSPVSPGSSAPASSASPAAPGTTPAGARGRGGLRAGWRALRESPAASRALVAIAIAHTAMVSVMSMTPVHLDHDGAGYRTIGLVLSVHIAGMFVLSPVVGWLADRIGRTRVLVLGMGILLAAALLSGGAGPHDIGQVTVGLGLLGIGWSCGLIAGSAMLTEAVPLERRPAVQGLSDLLMNVCGAGGTIIAGLIVSGLSYGTLGTAVAVMVTVTAAWLALTSRPSRTA
ncbi:MFS transporter [Streptosporangium sp. NPDC004379]|uniref:MFS transporter n=1 Tax=Streptosporangium sp. NPDC004379 TaxID=3366189 RepID=UPI0036C2D5D4